MTRPSDPGRLSDATPPSPLGQLLSSAERDLPSEQELAQLAARLGGVLDAAPVPAAAAPGSSLLVKAGVAVGVAGLVIGGLWLSHRPRLAAPASTRAPSSSLSLAAPRAVDQAPTAPAPTSVASTPNAPSSEPAPKPAALRKSLAEPVKSAAASADGLSEPALLEQARRALTNSPATALALTNQHAARFPRGVLAQEREVIAIEALRRLGRSAEADRRAAAFGQAFPGSAHQRMVEDPATK
jgi:hypothetical protein